MQVRIYFTGGNYHDMPLEDWDKIYERIREGSPNYLKIIAPRCITLNLNNISHVIEIDEPKAESTVVTPPSPAQVRNEKEKTEELTDRSLDSQLADPNLGEE